MPTTNTGAFTMSDLVDQAYIAAELAESLSALANEIVNRSDHLYEDDLLDPRIFGVFTHILEDILTEFEELIKRADFPDGLVDYVAETLSVDNDVIARIDLIIRELFEISDGYPVHSRILVNITGSIESIASIIGRIHYELADNLEQNSFAWRKP